MTKEQRWDYIVSYSFINRPALVLPISLFRLLTYFVEESFGLQNQIMLDRHLIHLAVGSDYNCNRRLCRRYIYSRQPVGL